MNDDLNFWAKVHLFEAQRNSREPCPDCGLPMSHQFDCPRAPFTSKDRERAVQRRSLIDEVRKRWAT